MAEDKNKKGKWFRKNFMGGGTIQTPGVFSRDKYESAQKKGKKIKKLMDFLSKWGPKIGKATVALGGAAGVGHKIGATLLNKAIEKAAQKEKQITVKEAIEQEKKKRKRDKKE